jgi:dihydroorotate dehydrogenase (NAD+) catalytic subunit
MFRIYIILKIFSFLFIGVEIILVMMNGISIELSTLKLNSPIILASGVLGVYPSSMNRLVESGIGAITSKSIGPRSRHGYPNPSIIGLGNGTFMNAVGLQNHGIDQFEKDIPKIKENPNAVLITSVFGDDADDFANISERAWKAGADAIELNVSCPHAEISCIGTDPDMTFQFVNAVRKKVKCPLFVKMNPNLSDMTPPALAAEKAGADVIVAINTVRALAIDVNTFRPILSHGTGGLSGTAIKPIGLSHVFALYKSLKIPIVGVGGISNWQDVIEYFLAGASAVQIGSALWKGESVISEMNEGIIKFLKEKSIDNISQLTGKAHENTMEVRAE